MLPCEDHVKASHQTAVEASLVRPAALSTINVPRLPQWAEEIERHVQPGRLSWARYLPPGAAAAAAAGNQADEEDGDVATRTRRSRRVAAAGGTVRPGPVSRACALGCTLAA